MLICQEFENQIAQLDVLTPKPTDKALQRYHTACNVVYDAFNNGLANQARSLRVMRIKKEDLRLPQIVNGRYVDGDWDDIERKLTIPMREIILDACDEQGVPYDDVDLTWNEEMGFRFVGFRAWHDPMFRYPDAKHLFVDVVAYGGLRSDHDQLGVFLQYANANICYFEIENNAESIEKLRAEIADVEITNHPGSSRVSVSFPSLDVRELSFEYSGRYETAANFSIDGTEYSRRDIKEIIQNDFSSLTLVNNHTR